MAKVVTSECLAKYGPPTIQVYGFIGGSLVNASKFQFMSTEEIIRLANSSEKVDKMSEDEKLYLYRLAMDNCSELSREEYLSLTVNLGFNESDGCPIKCWNCGSEDLSSENSYDETYIVEITVRCSKCKKHVGDWSYGNWMC